MCKVVSTSGLLWLMGSVVKNLPTNAGDARDLGSIPGSGRSPGGGYGNPLWYSCLENPMDWTEEPGRLQTSESQRVRHNCADTHTHTHTHTHNNYVFNILKNCPIVFQGYCNILYSEQQIMKIPISPHPHQHLFFLFIVAIGVSVNYFIVVLICIS